MTERTNLHARVLLSAAACALAFTGCGNKPAVQAAAPAVVPDTPATHHSPPPRRVRATGTIRALREFVVQAPQLSGQNSRNTLTKLVLSGTAVKAGDILVEFDRTQQLDNARDAKARFDDFTHQIDQRKAENRSNAEKRASDLQQAQAELAKAQLQLRKGELLSEIERLKNEVRVNAANEKLASLKKSHEQRLAADLAALRILELKRDRQQVALDRAATNAAKLVIAAPHAGMVALENIWRNGSMGPPQEGDQVWPGMPILRIFDPAQMEVHTYVAETDGAVLNENARARVRLDAYPALEFPARFVSASPVAASAIGSPIKRFAARFRLEATDRHLLPDLAAAVVIEAPAEGEEKR